MIFNNLWGVAVWPDDLFGPADHLRIADGSQFSQRGIKLLQGGGLSQWDHNQYSKSAGNLWSLENCRQRRTAQRAARCQMSGLQGPKTMLYWGSGQAHSLYKIPLRLHRSISRLRRIVEIRNAQQLGFTLASSGDLIKKGILKRLGAARLSLWNKLRLSGSIIWSPEVNEAGGGVLMDQAYNMFLNID